LTFDILRELNERRKSSAVRNRSRRNADADANVHADARGRDLVSDMLDRYLEIIEMQRIKAGLLGIRSQNTN
jgi:hypothetical protein